MKAVAILCKNDIKILLSLVQEIPVRSSRRIFIVRIVNFMAIWISHGEITILAEGGDERVYIETISNVVTHVCDRISRMRTCHPGARRR